MTSRIRTYLAIEALAFFLAASVHAGLTVHGYEHQKAMIAETVIGVVVALGLLASFVSAHATRIAAISVQAFALLGTLVGVSTIIAGIGPRTVPDYTFHAGILVVLVMGLRTAVMAQESVPGQLPQPR
ncbi:MAG TPA: hypothetical protein VFU86_05870 [Terriglobales bacterium]|nr:hypothetical protein [Terriglobales bacterium]